MKFPREVYDLEQNLRSALSYMRGYELEFRPNSSGYGQIKTSIKLAEMALASFDKINR